MAESPKPQVENGRCQPTATRTRIFFGDAACARILASLEANRIRKKRLAPEAQSSPESAPKRNRPSCPAAEDTAGDSSFAEPQPQPQQPSCPAAGDTTGDSSFAEQQPQPQQPSCPAAGNAAGDSSSAEQLPQPQKPSCPAAGDAAGDSSFAEQLPQPQVQGQEEEEEVDVIGTLAVVEELGPDELVDGHQVGAKGRDIWTLLGDSKDCSDAVHGKAAIGSGSEGVVTAVAVKVGSRVIKAAKKTFKNGVDGCQEMEAYISLNALNSTRIHRGIVRLLDHSRPSDIGQYLVLERMPETLAQFARKAWQSKKKLKKDLFRCLMTRVFWCFTSTLAPALLEMHSQGRIHGDLKPGNVLVSGLLSTAAAAPPAKQGRVAKMVDLGHSVVCHEGGCPTMGTRGWRAPEAETSRTYTAAADAWALGRTLLFLMDLGHYPVFIPEHEQAVEKKLGGMLKRFQDKDMHRCLKGLLSWETCGRADALADAARCAERHVAAGVHNA